LMGLLHHIRSGTVLHNLIALNVTVGKEYDAIVRD
jgi:hypothetical protein